MKKIDKHSVKVFFKGVLICFVAVSIPGLLILNAFQSRKYKELEDTVQELEEKQMRLVEQNKKLITDISLLSSSSRIESLAGGELNMKEAESEEIDIPKRNYEDIMDRFDKLKTLIKLLIHEMNFSKNVYDYLFDILVIIGYDNDEAKTILNEKAKKGGIIGFFSKK